MEIAPGVYSIWEFMGLFVHGFIVDDGDGLTIVDTLNDTKARRILEQIKRLGKTPADIKHIMLTHAHRSHLGGMALLKRLSGAPIYAHEWEADIISGDRRPQSTTILPRRPFFTWPGQIVQLFAKHPPSSVDQFLHDGDRVGVLQVVYTPGHTPGHLAFFWPERRVLFAGDTMVNLPKFDEGWPGFMLNRKQNRDSLRRLAGLNAEVLAVGHGDPITSGGAERLHELVSRLDNSKQPH